jgi:hypothetical protein
MISLHILFYLMLGFFTIIGALRGWAKEALVLLSGILALAIIELMVPKFTANLAIDQVVTIKLAILLVCAFIGYQTPSMRPLMGVSRFSQKSFQDVILGALIGAGNGFLFIGSAWFFIADANYPFSQIIAPNPATEAGQTAAQLLSLTLPNFLHAPTVYYALVIGCLIVLGVFI